jgi:general secretion pathway protein D
MEQNGTLKVDPATGAVSGQGSALGVGANINVLIDFMMRELHAKILNQQTLWTKDNEEAQFFKGQQVAFQTNISISDTGGRATSSFQYDKVGMTLRARPSITPEKNVDMVINIILSQLDSEVINGQPVRTQLDTTTNMIVQDGQTLMLGGMLFQEDSRTNRKVPFLGDLPLIGGLFRHKATTEANSELIVFVTPYVIETSEQMLPEAQRDLDKARQKLRHVQEELKPLADDGDESSADDDSDSPYPPMKAPAADVKPSSDAETKEKP